MNYTKFLITLANQLDKEGKPELADIIDKDFEEFLELLEEGKLTFDFLQSGGNRDPRSAYSNRSSETPLCGIDGPQ